MVYNNSELWYYINSGGSLTIWTMLGYGVTVAQRILIPFVLVRIKVSHPNKSTLISVVRLMRRVMEQADSECASVWIIALVAPMDLEHVATNHEVGSSNLSERARFISHWCNGSTRDSKPLSCGSSP